MKRGEGDVMETGSSTRNVGRNDHHRSTEGREISKGDKGRNVTFNGQYYLKEVKDVLRFKRTWKPKNRCN